MLIYMPRANAALTCEGIELSYDASRFEPDIVRQADRLTEKFATLTERGDLAREGFDLATIGHLSDWLDRVTT